MWRDQAHQLTADQIAELEHCERDGDDPPGFLLGTSRRYSSNNSLTVVYGGVPLPAGAATGGAWHQEDEPQAWRCISGPRRRVGDVVVWTAALQRADGSVVFDERERPAVHVGGIDWEHGLMSAQARELASLLIEAAADLDRLKGRP